MHFGVSPYFENGSDCLLDRRGVCCDVWIYSEIEYDFLGAFRVLDQET